nr:hypothetical protein CFP56_32180 [Quercus suber]
MPETRRRGGAETRVGKAVKIKELGRNKSARGTVKWGEQGSIRLESLNTTGETCQSDTLVTVQGCIHAAVVRIRLKRTAELSQGCIGDPFSGSRSSWGSEKVEGMHAWKFSVPAQPCQPIRDPNSVRADNSIWRPALGGIPLPTSRRRGAFSPRSSKEQQPHVHASPGLVPKCVCLGCVYTSVTLSTASIKGDGRYVSHAMHSTIRESLHAGSAQIASGLEQTQSLRDGHRLPASRTELQYVGEGTKKSSWMGPGDRRLWILNVEPLHYVDQQVGASERLPPTRWPGEYQANEQARPIDRALLSGWHAGCTKGGFVMSSIVCDLRQSSGCQLVSSVHGDRRRTL